MGLPENGPAWQRLRSGDIDMVPSLSWSDDSAMSRDASGMPVQGSEASLAYCGSDDDEMEPNFGSPRLSSRKLNFGSSAKSLSHDPGNLFGSRRGELNNGPEFMRNKYHQHALDNVVRWMIAPAPHDRPVIQQVLETDGVRWVASRRRAGATVFEGNWGPADEVLADDAEMMDV
jgi:mitosis inhibitor protein kinase SWE1